MDATLSEYDEYDSSDSDNVEELHYVLYYNHRLFESCHYAETFDQTPNPCLYITGLGAIGLPFSQGDAQRIISSGFSSVTAPQTWEVEPGKVIFANPYWLSYVKDTVTKSVLETLRVKLSPKSARLDLHKLILCGMGSQLSAQEPQGPYGVFATVIIILPSFYTGGQISITYASLPEVIHVAPTELFGISVLAWYKDIEHEYQPVTSGYRLSLHYNLVHVARRDAFIPMSPDEENAVYRLENVLNNWREQVYKKPIPSSIAYILDNQYNAQELGGGVRSLEADDLRDVMFLLPTAKELGYVVALGSLLHVITGYAYMRRSDREHDDSEDNASDDEQLKDVVTVTSTSNIVNSDGIPIPGLNGLHIDNEGLIPRGLIDIKEPDEKEYEPFSGDLLQTAESRRVDYRFRRTAMILIHKTDIP